MKLKKSHKLFDGTVSFYEHDSLSTKTPMSFSVYIPAGNSKPKNALIWLSGLTCTDENFITKAGIGPLLAGTDTMIICPDTSPRGLDLPGEHDSYDFGSGAGFYLNATSPDYSENYNMYDYVNQEIYGVLTNTFEIPADKISIMGHSMGGHGALTIGLKNPEKYQSISAFAPIVNPMQCDWGKKAFSAYLGEDTNSWKEYDSCELVASGKSHKNTLLIDQGSDDEFLEKQLLTENFVKVCEEKGQSLEVNMRPGYDHSFYFIASFLEDHIGFHRKHLV